MLVPNKKLLDRLRVFHTQCIRSSAEIRKKRTWEYRISAVELREHIGIHHIDYYMFSRQLCWLGIVSRMDFVRLPRPRRMLSCRVPHKRLVRRPRITYGEIVNKALRKFGFDKLHMGLPRKS